MFVLFSELVVRVRKENKKTFVKSQVKILLCQKTNCFLIWSIGQTRVTASTGELPHLEPHKTHNFSYNKHHTSSRPGRYNRRLQRDLDFTIGWVWRTVLKYRRFLVHELLLTACTQFVIINVIVVVVVMCIRPVRCSTEDVEMKADRLRRSRLTSAMPTGYLLNSSVADQCMQITRFRESLCLRPAQFYPLTSVHVQTRLNRFEKSI